MISLDEGKAGLGGPILDRANVEHLAFGFQFPNYKPYYGEWIVQPAENGRDFNIKIISAGLLNVRDIVLGAGVTANYKQTFFQSEEVRVRRVIEQLFSAQENQSEIRRLVGTNGHLLQGISYQSGYLKVSGWSFIQYDQAQASIFAPIRGHDGGGANTFAVWLNEYPCLFGQWQSQYTKLDPVTQYRNSFFEIEIIRFGFDNANASSEPDPLYRRKFSSSQAAILQDLITIMFRDPKAQQGHMPFSYATFTGDIHFQPGWLLLDR